MSSQSHKVLVVEDEMIIAMSLSDTLENLGYQVVDTCDSFEDTIQTLEKELPDVALVDIKLKGEKTGIDLGRVINERFQIPFIFLTSNSDKATIDQAKSTVPASYLLKPFEADELYAAIEVAIEQAKNATPQQNSALNEAIFVRKNQLLHRVAYSDIVYLKSDHVYVELYTSANQKHVIRGSLSQFLTSLPQSFFRTHRSYAVNLDYLEAINSLYVIANGEQVPIGKTYRSVLLEQVRVE
jgi:DNA-binding LytR/AlgR family response regulator